MSMMRHVNMVVHFICGFDFIFFWYEKATMFPETVCWRWIFKNSIFSIFIFVTGFVFLFLKWLCNHNTSFWLFQRFWTSNSLLLMLKVKILFFKNRCAAQKADYFIAQKSLLRWMKKAKMVKVYLWKVSKTFKECLFKTNHD